MHSRQKEPTGRMSLFVKTVVCVSLSTAVFWFYFVLFVPNSPPHWSFCVFMILSVVLLSEYECFFFTGSYGYARVWRLALPGSSRTTVIVRLKSLSEERVVEPTMD